MKKPEYKQYMGKLLCSANEASHMLDCDPSQVRYLINEGLIRVFRMKGQKHSKVVVASIYSYLEIVPKNLEPVSE